MIKDLIEIGYLFEGKFTDEYDYGSNFCIDPTKRNEYLQWLSKIGVYSEYKLKPTCPEMTEQILNIVKSRSQMLDDYNVIIGYLESINEFNNLKLESQLY